MYKNIYNSELKNDYITGPTALNNYSITAATAFRRGNVYFAIVQGKMTAAISSGAMDTPLLQLPVSISSVIGGVTIYMNNNYSFVPMIQMYSGDSSNNKVCQAMSSSLAKDLVIMFLVIAKIIV